MPWDAITSLATVISMIAFILTALYVRGELKAIEKDRFLAITNQLFAIWETKDFMDSQLWLLHRLPESTWTEFIAVHRADRGEEAFHRVGSFYDRVGALVRLGLINKEEILTTIGAYALAVWRKIGPLVREARKVENAGLFGDFERMLPDCEECYVPVPVDRSFATLQMENKAPASVGRIDIRALFRRMQNKESIVPLDVRRPEQQAAEPRTLPQAVAIPAAEIDRRLAELPKDREWAVYCA